MQREIRPRPDTDVSALRHRAVARSLLSAELSIDDYAERTAQDFPGDVDAHAAACTGDEPNASAKRFCQPYNSAPLPLAKRLLRGPGGSRVGLTPSREDRP